MYSSELYSQNDITSILPPYEIEPNGISVAGEEVVYSSADEKTHGLGTVTRNYSIIGDGVDASEWNGMLSSKMSLNVAVIRKRNCTGSEASPWFPKKVIFMAGNRSIETMAWAHSSDNLLERPGSADIGCQADDTSQNNLSMTVPNTTLEDLDMAPSAQDSDPSLSSINAPSWYNSQNPSLPSTSEDPTDFRMSSIAIEPGIDPDSLERSGDTMNRKESCINKGLATERDKATVDIQRFKVPIKIYPGNTRYQSLSYSETSQSVFPCPIQGCNSILRTRTALRKHALVHAERKFSCNQCGRSFAERTKLNRHMLIHTGQRAFKCNYEGCGKAFSLEANLKSHIKTHTGAYYSIYKHSGEKSYKCPHCSHAFTHPYNLRVHISRRHKEQNSA